MEEVEVMHGYINDDSRDEMKICNLDDTTIVGVSPPPLPKNIHVGSRKLSMPQARSQPFGLSLTY